MLHGKKALSVRDCICSPQLRFLAGKKLKTEKQPVLLMCVTYMSKYMYNNVMVKKNGKMKKEHFEVRIKK